MRLRPLASAATKVAAERRQTHVLPRRLDQLEQLGRLDGEDGAAEVEAETRGELEEVDAVAVVVHHLEQADDLADLRGGQRLERGGRGRQSAGRVGQVDLGDHRVDPVDEREERRGSGTRADAGAGS